jgi:Flp pilus assembly pilin Flp
VRHPRRNLTSDERGATAIEYCLLAAIIGVSLLLSARFLGDESIEMWLFLASTATPL